MFFFETRFARYWYNLARLDLGTSIRYRRPVLEVIANHWRYSIFLSLSSLLLAYFISIPLGVLAAVKQNQFADRGSVPFPCLRLLVLRRFALADEPHGRLGDGVVAVVPGRRLPVDAADRGDHVAVLQGRGVAPGIACDVPHLWRARGALALRADGPARRHPLRLHPYRAGEGPERVDRHLEARRAKRDDPDPDPAGDDAAGAIGG